MNKKAFIEFFLQPKKIKMMGGEWESPGGTISEYYAKGNVPWWFRYKLAEDLVGADFGCDFVDGLCRAERPGGWTVIQEFRKDEVLPDYGVNFCCSACYLNVGNLTILPKDEAALTRVASLYEPSKYGFWREGIGCILPYRYRSTMCLTGRCEYLRRNFRAPKETLAKIYKLTNIRSEWANYERINK